MFILNPFFVSRMAVLHRFYYKQNINIECHICIKYVAVENEIQYKQYTNKSIADSAKYLTTEDTYLKKYANSKKEINQNMVS